MAPKQWPEFRKEDLTEKIFAAIVVEKTAFASYMLVYIKDFFVFVLLEARKISGGVRCREEGCDDPPPLLAGVLLGQQDTNYCHRPDPAGNDFFWKSGNKPYLEPLVYKWLPEVLDIENDLDHKKP